VTASRSDRATARAKLRVHETENNAMKSKQEKVKKNTAKSTRASRVKLERVVRRQIAKELIDCIPTNWLDPLLTGKDSLLRNDPWGCKEIEWLLNAIKNKMKVVGNLSA
jgi:hypothetical protein